MSRAINTNKKTYNTKKQDVHWSNILYTFPSSFLQSSSIIYKSHLQVLYNMQKELILGVANGKSETCRDWHLKIRAQDEKV